MDRGEAAQIFRDVVIHRSRSDVPADVVEAMDTVLRLFGSIESARVWVPAPDDGDHESW